MIAARSSGDSALVSTGVASSSISASAARHRKPHELKRSVDRRKYSAARSCSPRPLATRARTYASHPASRGSVSAARKACVGPIVDRMLSYSSNSPGATAQPIDAHASASRSNPRNSSFRALFQSTAAARCAASSARTRAFPISPKALKILAPTASAHTRQAEVGAILIASFTLRNAAKRCPSSAYSHASAVVSRTRSGVETARPNDVPGRIRPSAWEPGIASDRRFISNAAI